MFLVLPAYLEKSGLSRTAIGVADGCFWSISMLVQPVLGPRLGKYGPKPFFLAGALLMVLMAGLFWKITVFPALVMVMRAGQGAGFATYLTSGWTWVANSVPLHRKGTYFGLFGMSSLVAGISGPVVAELVKDDYRRAFMYAFFSLLSGFCLLLLLPNQKGLSVQEPSADIQEGASSLPSEEEVPGFLGLLAGQAMRSTAWGSLGFGLAVGSLFAFVAAYLKSLGMTGFSLAFGLIALASGVARVVAGKLMDTRGPASIIFPSLLLLGGGCLGLASLVYTGGASMPVLVLSGISAGLGYGAVYPALNALAVDRLPPSAKGIGLSLVTASIDLGNTTGAALAGIVADQCGYSPMYAMIGGAVLLVSLLFYTSEQRAHKF